MADFTLQFSNQTDDVYTLALFAELDDAAQVAVAWLTHRTPPSGAALLQWTIRWNVGIAQCERGKFYGAHALPAEPGQGWVVICENGVPRLVSDSHDPPPNQIAIANRSGLRVNAGVGMSGGPMAYVANLLSGASAHFYVPMRIAVALFTDIEPGEVVTPLKMVAGPSLVEFPTGITDGIVTASLDGDRVGLELTFDS